MDSMSSLVIIRKEGLGPEQIRDQLKEMGYAVLSISDTDPQLSRNGHAFAKRLGFERLISDMAAGFVNLPVSRINQEIQNTLRRVAEFFQIDRCTIFRLASPPSLLEAVQTYTSEGTDTVAGTGCGNILPVVLAETPSRRSRGDIFAGGDARRCIR